MFDGDRLERLISGHFDGELAAEQRAELEDMLLSSAKARRLFLDHADFHGLLREHALRAEGSEWVEPVKPRHRRTWWVGGLAACLALVWAVIPARRESSPPTVKTPLVSEPVALLGMAVGVEWVGPALTPGAALPRGPLTIRKGTLRLDFYSGARVVLEGPAKLDLLSPDLARLEKGKLTAKVPPAAQGFTILHGDLRVVDRGTQFGMSVNGSDDYAVHVFDGEVELQGDVPDATARKLFEGEAVAIRAGISTAIAADRRSFADPVGMLEAAARESAEGWENWRARAESFRETPGLLEYFDFEDWEPSTMTLANRATGADRRTGGSVIGCERLSGRWERKAAAGFAKTSDRVRFRLHGTSPSLTLMAWVRVDSLPLDHNALLSMSPGEVGEIHWKLNHSGQLLLGLRAAQEREYRSWERLESPRVVTPDDFGRWLHLATVIDGPGGKLRHFVNGQQVASGPLQSRVPVRLGLANLGNFDGVADDRSFVRNFNGRIDEFALLNRPLSATEIRAIAGLPIFRTSKAE